jgi:hypothetical protein
MQRNGYSLEKKQPWRRKRQTPGRRDTALEFSGPVLREETVKGLIDDWIVPELVDQFLRCERPTLLTPSQKADNRLP